MTYFKVRCAPAPGSWFADWLPLPSGYNSQPEWGALLRNVSAAAVAERSQARLPGM